MGVAHYRILDVGLTLEAPEGPVLERFHQDYRRFAAPPGPGPGLRVRYDPSEGRLEMDGVLEDLKGHPRPDLHVTRLVIQAVMDRVQAFTVLHAAVVGSGAGALALAGPPGSGKTTTTLALLAAGWSYLSDDFCPLEKETGLVHPFPRSLWVRPGPGEEARNLDRGKLLYPLDGKGFALGTGPLPLKWLFCLDGGEAPAEVQQFRIGLREGREGPVVEELQALPGAVLERPGGPGTYEWLVRYPRLPGRTEGAKAILDRHRAAIWNVYTLQGPGPDFTQEPRLEPLSPLEAAFFLLRELKQAPGPRPGALLSQVGSLLAPVSCFRLGPGPMDKRLARVQDAVQGRCAQ